MMSICSRDNPFVYKSRSQINYTNPTEDGEKLASGIQKYVKRKQPTQVEPQMKNTFAWRLAFPGPELTKYGVA
jgi:hypothetical protein